MKDNFLLLHIQRDNSPAVVNIDCIEQIYTSSEYNSTVIVFSTNDDDLLVNESVEKVYNMINAKSKDKESKDKADNTKKKQQLNS